VERNSNFIGKGNKNDKSNWIGAIDNFYIYDRPISLKELNYLNF
jgi:hypothetical protein